MGKKKAIEICNNLSQSINMARKRPVMFMNMENYESPSANYIKLKRKKDYIMQKYNITKKDLNNA